MINNLLLQNTAGLRECSAFFQQRQAQYLAQINCFKCLKNIHLIDVGSNAGFYSKMALALLDVKHCDLFEPVENLYNVSKELLRNDPVTIHNFGLGHEEKEIDIYLGTDGNIGWNTMVEGAWSPTMVKQRAKIKHFDNLSCVFGFPEFNGLEEGDTFLVKIDTEGYEWSVLRGMRKFIEDNRPYFHIEFGFGKTHPQYGEEIKEFKHLEELGYTCLGVTGGKIDFNKVEVTTDLIWIP